MTFVRREERKKRNTQQSGRRPGPTTTGGWLTDLHGVGGAVSEAPDGFVAAVGELEGGGKRDPAGEVAVARNGEGALERSDAWMHMCGRRWWSALILLKVSS